jgi:hypothetical protein
MVDRYWAAAPLHGSPIDTRGHRPRRGGSRTAHPRIGREPFPTTRIIAGSWARPDAPLRGPHTIPVGAVREPPTTVREPPNDYRPRTISTGQGHPGIEGASRRAPTRTTHHPRRGGSRTAQPGVGHEPSPTARIMAGSRARRDHLLQLITYMDKLTNPSGQKRRCRLRSDGAADGHNAARAPKPNHAAAADNPRAQSAAFECECGGKDE